MSDYGLECLSGPSPTADGAEWNIYPCLSLIHRGLVAWSLGQFHFLRPPEAPGEECCLGSNKQKTIRTRETSNATR